MDALRFSSLPFESIGFLLIIMSREVAPVEEEGEKRTIHKGKTGMHASSKIVVSISSSYLRHTQGSHLLSIKSNLSTFHV